jgi:hypothetical protein
MPCASVAFSQLLTVVKEALKFASLAISDLLAPGLNRRCSKVLSIIIIKTFGEFFP